MNKKKIFVLIIYHVKRIFHSKFKYKKIYKWNKTFKHKILFDRIEFERKIPYNFKFALFKKLAKISKIYAESIVLKNIKGKHKNIYNIKNKIGLIYFMDFGYESSFTCDKNQKIFVIER